jgi:lipoprotein NlpD
VVPQQKKPLKIVDGIASPSVDEGPVVKPPSSEQSSRGKDQSQQSPTGKFESPNQPDKTPFPLKLPSLVKKESSTGDTLHSEAEQEKIQREKILFLWPVVGKVVSRYGIQPNGMFFNGIKIAAPDGTPVIAVADGIVIFSSSLKDYGETIILKHDNDYSSVYTQLGQRLVKREDRLKKGDRIATLAKSEIRGEALLNFEIRFKNRARNPLFFLP